MEDGKGGMTTKRIKKNVIKKNIMHEDYKNTLLNEEQMRHKMRTFKVPSYLVHQLVVPSIWFQCI